MSLMKQEKALILLQACYMTISLNLGLGEMDQQLHADNCVGQNKITPLCRYATKNYDNCCYYCYHL